METPLTPKEKLLQAEGEALLKAVAKNSGKSELVGPDGVRLDSAAAKPAEAAPVSPHQVMQQYQDAIAKRRAANAVILQELLGKKENDKYAKLRDLLYLVHQIQFWIRMELSTCDEMSDAMIEDLDKILQEAIYRSAQGFDFKNVVMRMQGFGVRLMKDYDFEYEHDGKVRRAKIAAVRKKLKDKPLVLPSCVASKMPRPFAPGQLIVLKGKPEDLASFTAWTTAEHYKTHSMLSWRLAAEDMEPTQSETVLPPKWWKDCARSVSSLDSAMAPVIDSQSVLVVVDKLGDMFTTDTQTKKDYERRSFAVKRLYQWAVNNLAAVIVCDDSHIDFSGTLPQFTITSNIDKSSPDAWIVS